MADQRALALLAQVTRGLLRHGDQRTIQHLGDRSTYIGLSDVGRAITCLRAAVASKLGNGGKTSGDDIARWLHDGDDHRISETLGRQLILQRGHWLEAGVESALRANGMNLIPQLEINDAEGVAPLRAHLDFVLVRGGDHPALRVLELKSTEHLPQMLYPAYEAQLYGQIGLLKALWSHPVFSLKDDDGLPVLERQTFPQLCQQLFGIALPNQVSKVDIEGWVLCLSMSEAKPFGPYQPNDTMLALCRRTAETLWTTTQAISSGQAKLDDVPYCKGFHPLCDWCDHADGCPKFKADLVNDPALDQQLAELAQLKIDRGKIETAIEVREGQIRQFFSHASRDKDWLSSGLFRFRTTQIPGRKTIDSARLRAELINRLGEAEAEAVLTNATTIGNGYERLTVSPMLPRRL